MLEPDLTSGSSAILSLHQVISYQRLTEQRITSPEISRLTRSQAQRSFLIHFCFAFYLEVPLAGSLKISPSLKKRAAQIQLILMDVDGTMTDGSVTLLSQPDGSALEVKTFDAHDGQGLTLAHTAGIRTGCITGRESAALLRRAQEMKMDFIYMKVPLKTPIYEEILEKTGLPDSAVAFIGDDLPDLPLLRRAGLAIAVGDAVAEVKKAAHFTTKALAGHGAVREAIELVLKSKGIWEELIDKARA